MWLEREFFFFQWCLPQLFVHGQWPVAAAELYSPSIADDMMGRRGRPRLGQTFIVLDLRFLIG